MRRVTVPFALCFLAATPCLAADDRAVCDTAKGDDAINACSRLLASGRDSGRALATIYRNRCAAWNGKREPDRAIADCSDAIRHDAGHVAAYVQRGFARRLKTNHDQALADYNEAIRLDARSAPGYAGRCAVYYNKRDFDRAMTDCNEAIRLDGKLVAGYAARCLVWGGKREPDRAMTDCNEALRLDPNNTLALNARGLVWAEKRDYDRAITDYDQVIRADPKYRAAYLNRAVALRAKREFDRAIADCDEAIRLDPTIAGSYNARGLARADKGDRDGAVADFDEAIRLDPKFALAYNNRGYARATKRDYDHAIPDYNEAIRLNPKYAPAFNNRGWAYKAKGDYDRAVADFNEAMRLDPKNAFSYYNRGVVHLDKREYDRAIADFGESLSRDKTYTAAFTNRGIAYERKGDKERARADFDAALALPARYNNGRWAHDTARERLAALTKPTVSANNAATASPSEYRSVGPRSTQSTGARVALVIANGTYPDADPPLQQPGNDARMLVNELKTAGFEVELSENLGKQQLKDALERFKGKVKPGTDALLYYSGFAIQSGRQNYMIPVNAQIWSERDVSRDGISFESVLGELNGSAVKLVIVDASRRNPFERRFRAAAAGLSPIIAPTNTLVMSAGGLGQVVNEGSGQNSVFMTELLRELRAPSVGLEEAFSRARIGISRATESEQVPWVSSSLLEQISFKRGEERRSTR